MAMASPGSAKAAYMKGPQKAALVLLALGNEAAASLMRALHPEEVERLTMEVANLGEIPSEVRDNIMREFDEMMLAQSYLTAGGPDVAREILVKALGSERAEEVLEKIQLTAAGEMFQMNMLNDVDSNQLLSFIQGEHPQTIALILVQLKSAQAARVLSLLPPELQPDVISRIATMEQISPEMIREIEAVLEQNLAGMVKATKRRLGGVPAVADMLNQVDRSTEKNIIGQIESDNPELAVQIRNLMFVFDDIIGFEDKEIQRILKEVDSRDLALALKIASEDLRNKVFRNLSQRAAEMLKDELEFLGPVPLRNVEECQRKIVDAVRRLDESGEIHLSRGDQGDELV
ncbi:MAG: flagellar motor switch protein FliG [Candidatus Eisenbacteria bacterium]|nr:flagellar motor switch protein FliG [Candidatus Eisenbacteria bacterium]MCC7142742.1 flagellar motor switch protein FliG [Candidatus Eisenbacteria bacterium]